MSSIKISIVIPVYNVEEYLNECIDSVLSQTYKNIEVILVDDGSLDNCPKICDEIALFDSRVKVIHKKNGGLSDARNEGMKYITGDYFIFLDSDDYWTDNLFLETVVTDKLQEEKDVIIFGYTKELNLLNTYQRNILFENTFKGLTKAHFLEKMVNNDKIQSTSCNKIVNSRVIKNHDMTFVKGRVSEDIDWTARILLYAENFDYFDKYIYFYRENFNSITHRISKKSILDLKYNIEKIVSWSENIKKTDYYDSYMNYCAYQYITFLNCVCQVNKKEITNEIDSMKDYEYLLKYNINKKVKLVYLFDKIFGYKGMLFFLKLYLKMKG